MNGWIDFRTIKSEVSVAAVLARYGWKGRRSRRGSMQGPCPIHGGQRADAFHIDERKNIFHCFSCQAGGDVLDLVAALEHCSMYEAASRLQGWFGNTGQAGRWTPAGNRRAQQELVREKETAVGPLSFRLQPIDSGHAYLRRRGIGIDTAARFGVGYYGGPGLMRGRVVIPIHDERGRLLAYAGRAVDEAPPKYKMPAGFSKSRVLFNLHQIRSAASSGVIVVEGFFDCMWLHQAGFRNAVALMGCRLSPEQERLLEPFQRITVMLDGDLTGREASQRIAAQLRIGKTIQVVSLAASQQPDQMPPEEIHRALATAARWSFRNLSEES